jgi:hypothetical protein
VSSPVKVVYIAGWGRSGSTILDGILGQIPGIVSVGEIKFIWERGYLQNRRCSCSEPFLSCPFWTETLRLALPDADLGQVTALDRASRRTRTRHLPMMLLPGALKRYARDLDWYREALLKLYRAVLEVGSGDMVVDSSKFPSYAFLLRQIPEFDLRVIHLVRDPRAVAYSWTRDKIDPDAPDGERMVKLPPVMTGFYWSFWNAALQRICAAQGIARLVVRYEDLVANPKPTLDRITRWAGIEGRPLPFVGDNEVLLAPSHAVSGNAVRFNSGQVRIVADDAWAFEMGNGARRAAWLASWPVRRRFGYE